LAVLTRNFQRAKIEIFLAGREKVDKNSFKRIVTMKDFDFTDSNKDSSHSSHHEEDK
jgi:hypothetical protein